MHHEQTSLGKKIKLQGWPPADLKLSCGEWGQTTRVQPFVLTEEGFLMEVELGKGRCWWLLVEVEMLVATGVGGNRWQLMAAEEVEVGGCGLKTSGRQPRNQAGGGAQGRQPHPKTGIKTETGRERGK